MRVGLLLQDPGAISRVHTARALLRSDKEGLELCFLASWEELDRAARADTFGIALVQPDFGSPGAVRWLEINRLRAVRKSGRVVLYCCGGSADSSVSNAPLRLRPPYLVLRDVDDEPGNLLCVLVRAWIRFDLEQQLRGSFKLGHLATTDFLTVPLASWPPVASRLDHARRHFLSERTLYRRHQELGIPTPDRLVRWGQLLLATRLSHLGVCPLARAAILAGRSGSTSLRQLCKNLTAKDLDEFLEPAHWARLWERLLRDLVA